MHLRAVAQARPVGAQEPDEGIVLAAGQRRQPRPTGTGRPERRGSPRYGRRGGGGIVRRRVQEILQAADTGPIALDACVQGHEVGIRGAVLVDHEPAADDVRGLQRAQVRRHPVGGQAGIRVGGEEDSVRLSVGLQPVGPGLQRHAPGRADMGLSAGQLDVGQAEGEGCENARGFDVPHRLDGPVRAVVGENHNPEGRPCRNALLRGQGGEQAGQALGLVPGGNADDAGQGGRMVGVRGHVRSPVAPSCAAEVGGGASSRRAPGSGAEMRHGARICAAQPRPPATRRAGRARSAQRAITASYASR